MPRFSILNLSFQFFQQPSPLWKPVIALRYEIFVSEQKVPEEMEIDAYDEITRFRETMPPAQLLDRQARFRLPQKSMICSSVNRFFMSNLLVSWDWTLISRATQTGGTSLALLLIGRGFTFDIQYGNVFYGFILAQGRWLLNVI